MTPIYKLLIKLASPRGFEPLLPAVKGRCPRPLDDGDTKVLLEIVTTLYGGAKRDRTADLLHAMQALSQLSYSPNDKVLQSHILPGRTLTIEQRF